MATPSPAPETTVCAAGRSVWSDIEIIGLSEEFVTAADETWRLQRGSDPECRFFQSFADVGHYRGEGTTRQGIYCCTPSGRVLGSVNTTNPQRMRRMLEGALERWAAMPKSERYLDEDPAKRREEIRRRNLVRADLVG